MINKILIPQQVHWSTSETWKRKIHENPSLKDVCFPLFPIKSSIASVATFKMTPAIPFLRHSYPILWNVLLA